MAKNRTYNDSPTFIPSRLESSVHSSIPGNGNKGPVADAKDIYDINHNKWQKDINDEVEAVPTELERIDGELGNRYIKEETYSKTEVDAKESGLQGQINTIKGGSTKSIATIDNEINGNDGIDKRLSTVEELAQISIDGGAIGIATASDFDNPTPVQEAKVTTVGAILGITDSELIPNSHNLVQSKIVFEDYRALANIVTLEHTDYAVGVINNDGTINTTLSGYRHTFVNNVSAGDLIRIALNRTQGGNGWYYLLFYDSTNALIEKRFNVDNYTKTAFDETICVPDNCVKIGINTSNIIELSKYGTRIVSNELLESINEHKTRLDADEIFLGSLNTSIDTLRENMSADPEDIPVGTVETGFIEDNGSIVTSFQDYQHRYVDVIPGSKVRITTGFTGGSGISMLIFFNSNDVAIGVMYHMDSSTGVDHVQLTNELVTIPDNAVKMGVNNGTVRVIKASGDIIKSKDLLASINDIISDISSLEQVNLGEVQTGFVDNLGQVNTSFSDYYHYMVNVTELENYYIKATLGGSGISFIVCFDSSDNVVATLFPLTGSSINYELDNWFTIPANTTKIAINNNNPTFVRLSQVGEPIESRKLQKQIDELKNKYQSLSKKHRLTFDPIHKYVYIRSRFNDAQDLVLLYSWDLHNKNFEPIRVYLGGKDLTLDALLAQGIVHITEDSICPFLLNNYWFIAGEHGYLIPTVVSAGHDKTDDDINSIWEDSANNRYYLARIEGNNLRLAPVITVNGGGQGKDTRNWTYGDTIPGSILTHVSGATHTGSITIDSQSGIQYYHLTRNVNRKFIIDGHEIEPDGTYDADKFDVIDEYILVNPAKVSNWGDPSNAEALIKVCQSYHFNGLSVTLDQTLIPNYSVWIDYWGAIQPMGLRPFSRDGISYKPLIVMPNSKIKNGINFNLPVDCSAGDNSKGITHAKSDYTQDEAIPDRIVEWLESTNGEKFIGFAAGYSMLRSETAKAKRWDNISAIFGIFSNDERNKFYLRATEQMMQPGEILHYTTFYSYFDPNKNTEKVYYYKEGASTIVYIESFAANAMAKIELPEELDSKSFEVVMKTNGVTLHSDTSVCNVIYATFDNNPNYAILKF